MKTIAIKNAAFVSVDNTKTFEDKRLNELYVPEGEVAARVTKTIAHLCKKYGMLTINVLEEHPLGHVSLAANYTNKNPFDDITYDEVKDRTEEDNGIGERAEFTLSELKTFLFKVKVQKLRPDHAIKGTEGVSLSEPLQEEDFDLKIIKGDDAGQEAYSGFERTTLHQELQQREKGILIKSGVAFDYCLGKTASDGADLGYQVYIITDGVRGIAQDACDEMKDMLEAKGVAFINSTELETILENSFIPEAILD